MPVLLLFFEAVKVVADATGDHLQHFRVHVVEVVPPVFQVGKHVLHRGVRQVLVGVAEFVQEVIVELPTGIDMTF